MHAFNPRRNALDGAPSYPDLKAIPASPEAVFILAGLTATEMIVDQWIEPGVRHVWIHCMMEVKPGLVANLTSVSPEAVRRRQAIGIAVIPGSCPNRFLKPDFGHAMMRVLWRTLGYLKLRDVVAPATPST